MSPWPTIVLLTTPCSCLLSILRAPNFVRFSRYFITTIITGGPAGAWLRQPAPAALGRQQDRSLSLSLSLSLPAALGRQQDTSLPSLRPAALPFSRLRSALLAFALLSLPQLLLVSDLFSALAYIIAY